MKFKFKVILPTPQGDLEQSIRTRAWDESAVRILPRPYNGIISLNVVSYGMFQPAYKMYATAKNVMVCKRTFNALFRIKCFSS